MSSSSSSTDESSSSPSNRLLKTQGEISRQQYQKENSSSSSASNDSDSMLFTKQADFVEHQRTVFDEMCETFEQEIPDNLVGIYEHLAKQILQKALGSCQTKAAAAAAADTTTDEQDSKDEKSSPSVVVVRILDVACGTGALFPYLMQAANDAGVALHLDGVDLSPNMVASAQKRIQSLLSLQMEKKDDDGLHHHHVVRVFESDILEFQPPPPAAADETTQKDDDEEEDSSYYYDAIVANACFGNFWDPVAFLQHVSPWLSVPAKGRVLVTHPLGAPFVQQLHEHDPATVPHLLPTSTAEYAQNVLRHVPLQVESVQLELEQAQSQAQQEPVAVPFYLASLVRVRHVLVPQLMRLRGVVDAGYGRGGKQLGFPTANLPARLFQDALQNVATGVYFGWALLEQQTEEDENGDAATKAGRNERHKAVVNVGYSPTFEGQENAEKIVEAHLILDQSIPDFYNETMRLQLHGFLRPEIKFPSFPALIAQIQADVQEAKEALELEPYITLGRMDPFLQYHPQQQQQQALANEEKPTGDCWVGSSGGDETASWEFQDTDMVLDDLLLL